MHKESMGIRDSGRPEIGHGGCVGTAAERGMVIMQLHKDSTGIRVWAVGVMKFVLAVLDRWELCRVWSLLFIQLVSCGVLFG